MFQSSDLRPFTPLLILGRILILITIPCTCNLKRKMENKSLFLFSPPFPYLLLNLWRYGDLSLIWIVYKGSFKKEVIWFIRIILLVMGLVSWANYFYPWHEADSLKGTLNCKKYLFIFHCLISGWSCILRKRMIFEWFQGFSEQQMTKLKKSEQISEEREREIEQVIWRHLVCCLKTNHFVYLVWQCEIFCRLLNQSTNLLSSWRISPSLWLTRLLPHPCISIKWIH